ncbi:hypothetical protein V3C99_013258 [Haemonchus contortus]|uniref:Histone-lysine N-methyltransferase SETMAR n=1 Tax=Haemonchus contortus TaxID=6289 RepID=A0A7I4Y0X6_HAECO
MEEDRRQPLRKDAKKMGVSHTVVAAHLELLGIVKKLDKWVPQDFTELQQVKRFEVTSSLLISQTITTQSYCDQIHKKYTKLGQMQPALVSHHVLLLLHENAQPHVSRIVFQKLNDLQIEALPHPHYSPDLSPTEYHLFKHLDSFSKERAFKNQGDVEAAFLESLESRSPDFYKNGIDRLVSR